MVCSVVERELCLVPNVLCLECMHLIDMTHAWAGSTHSQHQLKIRGIHHFEQQHHFTVLPTVPLTWPPATSDIPLTWIHEFCSICTSRCDPSSTVAMGTTCSFCSAASQFLGWGMSLISPLDTFLDQQHKVFDISCHATDSYSFSLSSKGMTRHLGADSKPATPLLFQHVHLMDHLFVALQLVTMPSNSGHWQAWQMFSSG